MINRGAFILQGVFYPTLMLDTSPNRFKLTTDQALQYGLIKDGVLVDISNWNVEIVYEKPESDNTNSINGPVYTIISLRKLE